MLFVYTPPPPPSPAICLEFGGSAETDAFGAFRDSSSSFYWANKRRFDDARRRLRQIEGRNPGWDSHDAQAPNQVAVQLGWTALTLLEAAAFPPSRVMPSVEGGIAISFARGIRRAEFEVYNTGDIAVATYLSSDGDEPCVWELEPCDAAIRDAIEKIRVHIAA